MGYDVVDIEYRKVYGIEMPETY